MPGLRRHVDFALPALLIALVSAGWSAWAIHASGGPLEAAWVGGTVLPLLLDAGVQPWRLLCAGWLHTDAAHALANLPALLLAGLALARLARPAAVYAVWGLGALAGCGASWALTRTWAHGASGGNAALAAAVLWLAWRRWAALDKGLRHLALVGSVPWLVALVLPRTGPVDHFAHLAGVLIGPLAVGAGRRIALALGVAHAVGFGGMIHAALRPPIALVAADPVPGICAGPAVTDGLNVACRAAPDAAGALPQSHALHLRDGFAIIAPAGPRATRILAAPGRFFDGSANLR